MSNPLMGNNMPNGGNNPINMMMQFINNGGNPKQLMEQFMNNSQSGNIMKQLQNMAGGKSPKDFAMQLAKQKGIDTNQIIQLVNKMGGK